MRALAKSNSMFPSFFDDFLTRDFYNWPQMQRTSGGTLPSVNVKETNDMFELEVAAPGMSKDDFNITLDNGLLTISSERENKNEEKDSDGNYTRKEFSYQSFTRSFSLPEKMVEAEKISAKYTNGILHVTVPKTEAAKVKPARQIAIA